MPEKHKNNDDAYVDSYYGEKCNEAGFVIELIKANVMGTDISSFGYNKDKGRWLIEKGAIDFFI
jgi:hypothetical protein